MIDISIHRFTIRNYFHPTTAFWNAFNSKNCCLLQPNTFKRCYHGDEVFPGSIGEWIWMSGRSEAASAVLIFSKPPSEPSRRGRPAAGWTPGRCRGRRGGGGHRLYGAAQVWRPRVSRVGGRRAETGVTSKRQVAEGVWDGFGLEPLARSASGSSPV